MTKQITVDMKDATTTVTLKKENGVITISGEYMLEGAGFSSVRSSSFVPSDFTAAQRTALQNVYDLVITKCRTAEGV